MLLFVQFLFLFFFSENVSSNIHHPRGISPHEESRIKSNRIRSHWIYGKTVRNFFPWSNLERTSGENLSCSLYTCRDIASIWRLFFSFIATAGTWETRANRKVAETPLFFFTPCWKSTNISSAARFHEFNSERNGYPRFALQPCNRCVFLLHISDIQLLRIVRIDLLIHNLCSLNKYLTDKVNFFYTFF